MNRPVEIKTPDSIMSPYPASDYSDWETETENDKTPTRAEAKNLTLEELQAAAMKLNLCIVTNKESANSDLPVVPPRQNKNDLSSPIFTDSKGSMENEPLTPEPCMSFNNLQTLNPFSESSGHSNASDTNNCNEITFCGNNPFTQHPIQAEPSITNSEDSMSDDTISGVDDSDEDATDISLSDESECITVKAVELKLKNQAEVEIPHVLANKQEMEFLDLYDEPIAIDNVESQNSICLGNDPNLNSKAIKEEYNIKECLKEENTQEMHNEPAVDLKVDVFTSEEARKLETKESLFSAEENLVISRSVSCETVKTEDSGKPRSHKKVKAPLPPVAAIPYTAVTLSAAINPSTADVPSTTSTPSAEASTDVTAPISSYPVAPSLSEPNAITDALSLSSINNDKRGQIESGVDDVGKVLYRSKGYEDTEPSVGQSERQKKINIRDISLENQILDRESVSEAPLSKTFMRNQEFLQPLVQDREVNRLSGGYDSDENNPFR